jgi:hypothetical protein
MDCVNLYGKAMMEPLPTDIKLYTKWVEKVDKFKDKFDVKSSDKYEINKHLKNKDPTQEIREFLK